MSAGYVLKPQIDFISNLNDKERASLKWYTDEGYAYINTTLRSSSIFLDPNHKYYYDTISNIFNQVPPIKKNLTVYRGMSLDSKYKSNIIEKAFASTSLNIGTAQSFSGRECCLLEILVLEGCKVLPLYTISKYTHEFEILLDKNGIYNIYNTQIIPISGKEVKFLKCTYSNSYQITNDINKIEDPGAKDKNLIMDRIVIYLKDIKEDNEENNTSFNFDLELKVILDKDKAIKLTSEDIELIKKRIASK